MNSQRLQFKTSRAPRTVGDPRTGPCNPEYSRITKASRILFYLGGSLVRDPGNGSGWEQGCFHYHIISYHIISYHIISYHIFTKHAKKHIHVNKHVKGENSQKAKRGQKRAITQLRKKPTLNLPTKESNKRKKKLHYPSPPNPP